MKKFKSLIVIIVIFLIFLSSNSYAIVDEAGIFCPTDFVGAYGSQQVSLMNGVFSSLGYNITNVEGA